MFYDNFNTMCLGSVHYDIHILSTTHFSAHSIHGYEDILSASQTSVYLCVTMEMEDVVDSAISLSMNMYTNK